MVCAVSSVRLLKEIIYSLRARVLPTWWRRFSQTVLAQELTCCGLVSLRWSCAGTRSLSEEVILVPQERPYLPHQSKAYVLQEFMLFSAPEVSFLPAGRPLRQPVD